MTAAPVHTPFPNRPWLRERRQAAATFTAASPAPAGMGLSLSPRKTTPIAQQWHQGCHGIRAIKRGALRALHRFQQMQHLIPMQLSLCEPINSKRPGASQIPEQSTVPKMPPPTPPAPPDDPPGTVQAAAAYICRICLPVMKWRASKTCTAE